MKRILWAALCAIVLCTGTAVAQPNSNCENDNCRDDCRRGGFYAGFGFYYLQPHFETNPAFATSTGDFVDGVQFSSVNQHDFTYDLDGAPSFWLGWQNECGFGARLRYFEYAQGADEGGVVPDNTTVFLANPLNILGSSAIFVAPGTNTAIHSDLNVLTLELELTKQWIGDDWSLTAGAGLRYAHLAQTYHVYTGESPVGVELELESGHSFNGLGPMVSLEAKRRLGNSFGLFANGRGSLIFGTGHHDAFADVDNVEVDFLSDSHMRQADVLPIAELEAGVEVNRSVGNAALMLQVGLVGQTYFGAGNAANVTTAIPSGRSAAGGVDNSSNLGLCGLMFRLGVDY